ncbi:DUF2290 domain-containing protein [Qiania dongpingensis]|uniref:DUF2290 domain-containing protein n=1 Tax=Qiania dongpingensis TaxID=2763669 RepID=A0A7G9G699_9FIRM|nr:DUF2290 domain-containing protein [Qiania dongpingensis]QNM06331.1 DUF2290 domain-containing protein [Qiania dongpingensis]
MNLAKYKISLLKSIDILRKFDLFKERNTSVENIYDSRKFSSDFFSVSNSNKYLEIYNMAIKNNDYDILLIDDSILQFSLEIRDETIVQYRFAYYQNPRTYPTYNEFLQNEFNVSEKECGSTFLEEYEQIVCEASLNDCALPIRYDYDEKLYDPNFHYVSHIHIGHNNELRIGADRILSPDAFVIFVIRNIYFSIWKNKCQNDGTLLEMCFKIKNTCSEINEDFIKEKELNTILLR